MVALISNGDDGRVGHGGHLCSRCNIKKQQSTTIFVSGGNRGGGVVDLANLSTYSLINNDSDAGEGSLTIITSCHWMTKTLLVM